MITVVKVVEFAVQTVRRIIERDVFLTFSNSYLAVYGSTGIKSRVKERVKCFPCQKTV